MSEAIETQKTPAFEPYGIIGIMVILVAQILTFIQVYPISAFFTPIAWTGYIMFVDALVFKLRGESFIQNRGKQFLIMLPLSIACWLIFELYNLHLRNWYYTGLPESMLIQLLIACWAFATIFPGILETSELIDTVRMHTRFTHVTVNKKNISRVQLYSYIVIGVIFLGIPLVLPTESAKYLFGLVWMGFVFLLDPVNYLLGLKSLFYELENGKIDKLLSLFLSGIICGFLWEFWNYWAVTRWVYTVPFLQKLRIFEMPMVGFLGFLPFAVECYVMYYFFLFVVHTRRLHKT